MKRRRSSILFFVPLLTPSPTFAHPSNGGPRMEITGLSCEPHNWAAPSRSHHHHLLLLPPISTRLPSLSTLVAFERLTKRAERLHLCRREREGENTREHPYLSCFPPPSSSYRRSKLSSSSSSASSAALKEENNNLRWRPTATDPSPWRRSGTRPWIWLDPLPNFCLFDSCWFGALRTGRSNDHSSCFSSVVCRRVSRWKRYLRS